jgi:hypothetical protein
MVRELEPVVPEMFEENTPGLGRRYLETLRAREAKTNTIRRAMDGLAARIAEAATRFVRRQAMHEQMTQLPLRTMSHLISREVVDQYREVVGAVRTGTEFRFIMIGPRAPYSFCALGSAGGVGGPHGMKLAD